MPTLGPWNYQGQGQGEPASGYVSLNVWPEATDYGYNIHHVDEDSNNHEADLEAVEVGAVIQFRNRNTSEIVVTFTVTEISHVPSTWVLFYGKEQGELPDVDGLSLEVTFDPQLSDPETMYVTVDGAGNKDGTSWANAFDQAQWLADWTNNAQPGDIYYLYSGTYTLTDNQVTARAGSNAALISIIGCSDQGTPPTEAQGNDRPLISCGNKCQIFNAAYHGAYNIRWTGTLASSIVVGFGAATFVRNCSCAHTGTGTTIAVCVYGNNVIFFDCEFSATNGTALSYDSDAYYQAFNCLFRDSVVGARLNCLSSVIGCSFDTCSTAGCSMESGYRNQIVGNTIYNCGIGISATAAYQNFFLNNIIVGCTTGASWTTEYTSNHWDYNNWFDNGTDVSNVTKGLHDTAYDPDFENAAGGDFRLKAGSDCLGAGFGMRLGVGA